MRQNYYNTAIPEVTALPVPSAPFESDVFSNARGTTHGRYYQQVLESKRENKLGSHKAKVAVILDVSGSMEYQNNLFSNGSVQRFIDKSLGMAAAFDDDREMEFFTFGETSRFEGKVNLGNSQTFLPDLIRKCGGLDGILEGRTDYGEAVKTASDYYFSGDKKAETPVFALFLTDGDCNDDKKNKAEREIMKASQNPMFIKFIAIGAPQEQFPFLQNLDDMKGRKVDNVDVVFVRNPDDLKYNDIIREYRGFVVEAKKKGMFSGPVGFNDKEFVRSEGRTVEGRDVIGDWTRRASQEPQRQADTGCGCTIS